MFRTLFAGIIVIAVTLPAQADVRITPVRGYIELSTAEVSCPSLPSGCTLCVNDAATPNENRLMLALGETYPFTTTTGLAEGIIRPFVEVDGVPLTPDLLPCGAYFTFGIGWQDYFTPNPCGAVPAGVTYEIGSFPETTVTHDGNDYFVIPATEASEVPFRISICSQFFWWGAGCDVSGSSDEGWELWVPAAMNAATVPPGDAAPVAMPGSDFALDFSSSAGGVVSASHAQGDPPLTPPIEHLNGYWDIHTDLAAGTFSADVSFGFDASTLPPEVDPNAIIVAVYNVDTDAWNFLPTTVDMQNQTATAPTDRLSKFVLMGMPPLPTERASWGAIKALYKTD